MRAPGQPTQHHRRVALVTGLSENVAVDDDDRVRTNDHRIVFELRDRGRFLARETFGVRPRYFARVSRLVDVGSAYGMSDTNQRQELATPWRG
jgi:hypothetical protein